MGTSANMVMANAIDTRIPAYVKLSRPRLHQPMARARLFALLDRLRANHPVIWLAAPPGSGKTALAGTWLHHAAAPALWCQLDQADADPATLFFYLAEAVRTMPGAMPWEAPGGADQSRLFFRTFYSRLPAGSIVVFDNVQDVDWQHTGKLLEHAFSEVPQGVTVLAVSRDAPPATLARMELNNRLAVVGWDDLRFNPVEARVLARLDSEAVPAWLDHADGWAAGIVMLRTLARDEGPGPSDAGIGNDAVFRYFAGEILQRLPAARQQLLLQLACLPQVSAAEAVALTGEREAAHLLESLYTQRLFIARSGGGEQARFQFQPLFGAFLRREASARLDPAQRQHLMVRAAAILDSQGDVGQAAALLQQAGAGEALAALLLRHAPTMIAAGRGEAWRQAMSWLDADVVEARPWLWYWHALSLQAARPLHARKLLMRTEREFARTGAAVARLLALAAIIDTHDGEWSDPASLPYWAGQLSAGLADIDLHLLEPDQDLRLHARLAGALLACAPESPLLAPAAERALQAMALVDNAAALLAAAQLLLPFCDWLDSPARANALIAQIARIDDDPALDPAQLVRWHTQVARWYSKEGDDGQAQRSTTSARRIVSQSALPLLLCQTLEIEHLLRTGELAQARALLDQLLAAMATASKREQAEGSALEGHWRALSGDLDGATRCAHDALRLTQEAGMAPYERARFEAFLGACLAWSGELASALRYYQGAAAAAYGVQGRQLREECRFIEAYACWQGAHPEAGMALLRDALEAHRARECASLFSMVPQLAARIAALALQHQIEVRHVRALILRQNLPAPRRCVPGWPWPVAVRTLGSFEMAIFGEPVVWSGKSQQRPLALLKSLVAAGEGGRTQQTLLAQLWGDADVAKSALSVTVHRLRKLLQFDDVIFVSGGRIRLCGVKVWSDLDALAEIVGDIATMPVNVGDARLRQAGAALLDLYRGPFFDGGDESWILPERERARHLFLGAAGQLGERLEAGGAWADGLALYQRALETEPLSEANYRGAMRCAHALDGIAAAFAVYRRCRETLSILLGIVPSPETEKLAVSLGLK
ncbi:BTAD domain-containing putative transcriptional regulator [Massilia sp. CF038]|uniref:BTAD domain-containing putative transcriptional regulator n=1 Tax=Massilia sp. CF038 TaxID=1881045 RepID=UPI00091A02C4|nr:BTAD domain-containing putative transcriptional regulator [Massilia sp. CF038]SHH08716.1 ATP-, maltotriose-and DNA-dependent transcriptional regulator MalT [Massilia sp. CF038]